MSLILFLPGVLLGVGFTYRSLRVSLPPPPPLLLLLLVDELFDRVPSSESENALSAAANVASLLYAKFIKTSAILNWAP